MPKQVRIILICLVAGLILGLAMWTYYNTNQIVRPAAPTPAPPANVAPNPISPNLTYKVYFSRHPGSDEDPARISGYIREASKPNTEPDAVAQLIAGSKPDETKDGAFTMVVLTGASNCGVDFRLTIKNQLATLQFCRTFATTTTIGLTQAAAQINTTLEQFSNIDKVSTLNQAGQCLFGSIDTTNCKRQP